MKKGVQGTLPAGGLGVSPNYPYSPSKEGQGRSPCRGFGGVPQLSLPQFYPYFHYWRRASGGCCRRCLSPGGRLQEMRGRLGREGGSNLYLGGDGPQEGVYYLRVPLFAAAFVKDQSG